MWRRIGPVLRKHELQTAGRSTHAFLVLGSEMDKATRARSILARADDRWVGVVRAQLVATRKGRVPSFGALGSRVGWPLLASGHPTSGAVVEGHGRRRRDSRVCLRGSVGNISDRRISAGAPICRSDVVLRSTDADSQKSGSQRGEGEFTLSDPFR
jgi:hypothetical protein